MADELIRDDDGSIVTGGGRVTVLFLRGLLAVGCCAAVVAFAAGNPSARDATVIVAKNPFDPEHRAWPDIEPAPAPISTEDVQLYGVVIAGNVKRAVVKVGGNLKHLAGPNGRAFLTVREGQTLGAYVVGEIQPHQVLLSAGSTRQSVVFGKKTDRPLAPMMAVQAPSPLQAPTAPVVAAPNPVVVQPFPGGGAAVDSVPVPPAVSQAQANLVQTPSGGAAPPSGPQPGMSLAEAIAAAQAAAASGNQSPAPNPFLMRK